MPLMRTIVRLAAGYAITKMLARKGGPQGLLNAVLSPGSRSSGHDHRTNSGPDRTPRQKRGDARRRV